MTEPDQVSEIVRVCANLGNKHFLSQFGKLEKTAFHEIWQSRQTVHFMDHVRNSGFLGNNTPS